MIKSQFAVISLLPAPGYCCSYWSPANIIIPLFTNLSQESSVHCLNPLTAGEPPAKVLTFSVGAPAPERGDLSSHGRLRWRLQPEDHLLPCCPNHWTTVCSFDLQSTQINLAQSTIQLAYKTINNNLSKYGVFFKDILCPGILHHQCCD